jgi:ketosteroid isomerase-like protein
MLQPTNETVRPQRPAGPTPDVAAAKEDQDMRSTKEVIDNHLERFGERNLDGILSDYASGAVLFTPEGPLRGVESIRELFQAMLAEFGKPGASFNLKQLSVVGDHGFILWTAETADNVYELGTDTFVVHDGKIQVQSFAGKITPKC